MPALVTEPSSGLRHNCLSAIENVAQTLGAMAPSGTIAVILPLLIAKTGNGTWLLFVLTFSIFLLVMVSIARFAGKCASAGSLAAWGRLGLGFGGGLATGWIYIFALAFCIPSATLCSASFLDMVLTPWLGPSAGTGRIILLTLVIGAAAGWASYQDIKLSTDLMLVIECVSVGLMIFLMGAAMFHTGAWVDRPQLTLQHVPFSAFQAGLVLAFLTMGGFETVTTLGEEARNPTRIIPRVIFGCLVPLGLVYLVMTYCQVSLAHAGMLSGGLDGLAVPFDNIAHALRLPWLGPLSSLGVALSYFACALGSLNAGSRVLYSMAQEGLFWRSFGQAHPRNATPHRAIALISLFGLAVPVSMLLRGVDMNSSVDYLSQLGSLGFIGAYFLVCLALPIYLRREGELRWTHVAVAAGALVMLLLVLFFSLFPVQPAPYCYLVYIFAGLVLCGVAISLALRRVVPLPVTSPITD